MEPEQAQQALPLYVEYLALLYHEARNARRLIQLNAVSRKTFGAVVDKLPPDRVEAWKRLIHVQQRCVEPASAKEIETAFAREFGCNLEDLHALFTNQAWKRLPQSGGPPWAAIAQAVARLRDALQAGNAPEAVKLAGEISTMHHNSGTVRDRLAGLKGGVR
jgi:hypothetical protein